MEATDYHALSDLLIKGINNIESAKDKEIVLVLGNTGSGKSTTVNYLLDSELVSVNTPLGPRIGVKGDTLATIGHNSSSCTLYPNVYVNRRNSIAYCDCPGFLDNRSDTEVLTVSISTQAGITLASRVKAVLLVIDLAEFSTSRGESFRKLLAILSRIFSQISSISKSIIFAITKKDNRSIEVLEKTVVPSYLKEFIDNYFVNLQKLIHTKPKKAQKINDIIYVLQLMIDNIDRVVVLDVLDGGNSRKRIEEKLNQCTAIHVSAFNFLDAADKLYADFYDTFIQKVNILTKVLYGYMHTVIALLEVEEDCRERKKQIECLKALINTQGKLDPITIQKHKRIFVEFELNNRNLKNEIEQKLNNIETEIKTKNDILQEIDTEEPVEYSKLKFENNFILISIPNERAFRYNGPPYCNVVKTCNGGYFEKEVSLPEQGKYEVTYVLDAGILKHGLKFISRSATVITNIHKREKPENKSLIATTKTQLSILTKEREHHLVRLEEINHLLSYFENSNSPDTKKLAITYKQEIQNSENILMKNEQSIETLKKKKELFENQKAQWAKEICSLTYLVENYPLKCKLFDTFLYLVKLKMESQSNGVPNGVDPPEEFVCPITLELMKFPVTLNCGHSFDLVAISDVAKRLDNNCPICKQPYVNSEFVPDYKLKAKVELWHSAREAIKYRIVDKKFIDLKNKVKEEIAEYKRMLGYLEKLNQAMEQIDVSPVVFQRESEVSPEQSQQQQSQSQEKPSPHKIHQQVQRKAQSQERTPVKGRQEVRAQEKRQSSLVAPVASQASSGHSQGIELLRRQWERQDQTQQQQQQQTLTSSMQSIKPRTSSQSVKPVMPRAYSVNAIEKKNK